MGTLGIAMPFRPSMPLLTGMFRTKVLRAIIAIPVRGRISLNARAKRRLTLPCNRAITLRNMTLTRVGSASRWPVRMDCNTPMTASLNAHALSQRKFRDACPLT
ncbi:hypothetical protein RSSM_00064 [Rhodopirellula sallentina SM41]|uniref:Uncharacterized protein n=1 Tax=Rhodopirellula sallentina SM41 TaxID=1263870 RepID=M5UAS6_9BACT|nr:hypothetical protein RSSM_00064 [Rhodopirellula sallentina SM41]